MTDKRNRNSKSPRKQSANDPTCRSKPDVMVVTKDVMIPIILPAPPNKFFRTSPLPASSKAKISKTHKYRPTLSQLKRAVSVSTKDHIEPSLAQIASGKIESKTRVAASACLFNGPAKSDKSHPIHRNKKAIASSSKLIELDSHSSNRTAVLQQSKVPYNEPLNDDCSTNSPIPTEKTSNKHCEIRTTESHDLPYPNGPSPNSTDHMDGSVVNNKPTVNSNVVLTLEYQEPSSIQRNLSFKSLADDTALLLTTTPSQELLQQDPNGLPTIERDVVKLDALMNLSLPMENRDPPNDFKFLDHVISSRQSSEFNISASLGDSKNEIAKQVNISLGSKNISLISDDSKRIPAVETDDARKISPTTSTRKQKSWAMLDGQSKGEHTSAKLQLISSFRSTSNVPIDYDSNENSTYLTKLEGSNVVRDHGRTARSERSSAVIQTQKSNADTNSNSKPMNIICGTDSFPRRIYHTCTLDIVSATSIQPFSAEHDINSSQRISNSNINESLRQNSMEKISLQNDSNHTDNSEHPKNVDMNDPKRANGDMNEINTLSLSKHFRDAHVRSHLNSACNSISHTNERSSDQPWTDLNNNGPPNHSKLVRMKYSWENLVPVYENNHIAGLNARTETLNSTLQPKYSWQSLSSPNSTLNIVDLINDSVYDVPQKTVGNEKTEDSNQTHHHISDVTRNESSSKLEKDQYSWNCMSESMLLENDVNNIEKIYSWQDIDLQDSALFECMRGTTIDQHESENNLNSTSDYQMTGAKYSWQNFQQGEIKTKAVDSSNYQSQRYCEQDTTIQTSSSDKDGPIANLIEPKFKYSWQKLTSKYLNGKDTRSSLNDAQIQAIIHRELNVPTNNILTRSTSLNNTFHRATIANLRTIVEASNNRRIGTTAMNLPESPRILDSNSRMSAASSKFPPSPPSNIEDILTDLNSLMTRQQNTFDSYLKKYSLAGTNSDEPISIELSESSIRPAKKEKLVKIDLGRAKIPPVDAAIGRLNIISGNSSTLQESDSSSRSLKDYNLIFNPTHIETQSSIKNNFPSILTYPISFDNASGELVSSTNDRFKSTDNNQPNEIADMQLAQCKNLSGLLLPILEADTAVIDDFKNSIEIMDKLIGDATNPDSLIDREGKTCYQNLSDLRSTKPLQPEFQIPAEIRESDDHNPREAELRAKLENALVKLRLSEQPIDTNWNLDYMLTDTTVVSFSPKTELPKDVEDHAKDIIKSAEEYLAKLQKQLTHLRKAHNQITNSSRQTSRDIETTFQRLMDDVCRAINERRNLLRLETEVLEHEGLVPIKACIQEVDAQIRSTQHLIVLTENIRGNPQTFSSDRFEKIINATSHMGRIPAVPMPEELPFISFRDTSDRTEKEILPHIGRSGCVSRMGPAQFTDVLERPGGLRLKWHVVDPEYSSEEQIFIVQKAPGEVFEANSPGFETLYTGSETSCFVRDLVVDEPITLRVGIHVPETAWSVHHVAITSIPAYSWDVNNADYLVTNSGCIATKVTENKSTLFSRGPQVAADHIVEFRFLEATLGSDDEGVGLVSDPNGINDDLKRSRSLLITPNGNIFMHGEQKLMQLPRIQLGTRIVFTTLRKDNDTLRVTIECADKAVTYDWVSPTPVYLAARFIKSNKWNFMIK